MNSFDTSFDRKDRQNLIGQRFTRLTVIEDGPVKREPRGTLVRRWLCQCDCGNTISVKADNLKRGGTKSCGCLRAEQSRNRSGKNSPNWKGGLVSSRPDGYIMELAKNHPKANQAGYVLQHRLVMENHLGRILFDNENVHHKNGNRSDNCIENLELWCTHQPSGQRVVDLIQYAKEILEQYHDQL